MPRLRTPPTPGDAIESTRKQGGLNFSHSFTLVCCGVIPVDISWLVGLGRFAAESRRVISRRSLGQNVGQRRKLFGRRRPAVSFLSRGQKQTELQVADILAESVNSPFQPLFTHFEEGIIASGFIPVRFRRSEVVCCDHGWTNRCCWLGIESRCAFSPCTSSTADRISPAYCIIGIFMNDSEDVTFQPPLEFRLRGW